LAKKRGRQGEAGCQSKEKNKDKKFGKKAGRQ
jgi:hypothetical protein